MNMKMTYSHTTVSYMILVFYGILAIITATIGNYLMPKGGFSMGYLVGAVLSIVLWLTVGKKYAHAS